MKVDILTLFPASLKEAMASSILHRSQKKSLVDINLIDIRKFTKDKHKKVDAPPYGGGSGMVMQTDPIINAYNHVTENITTTPKVILTTPRGQIFNQKLATALSGEEHLIVICGHYEGIDERVSTILNPIEISIGNYVLTGGEPAAWVIIDSIIRLIPNVLGDQDSIINESFNNNLIEPPHYTRPAVYMGLKVPDVLLSGNHSMISAWRRLKAEEITKKRRPDLYRLYSNKKYK